MSEVDGRRPLAAGSNVLRVPADVAQLAAVRAFVREQALLAGADAGAIPDIVQAVDESVTNAIVHGYGGRDGEVEVEVDHAGRSLIVRLRDKATPFDPTLVPPPDTSQPRVTGMGVLLTRELTDAMAYRRTDDGNELTLVKDCIEQEEGDGAEHQRGA